MKDLLPEVMTRGIVHLVEEGMNLTWGRNSLRPLERRLIVQRRQSPSSLFSQLRAHWFMYESEWKRMDIRRMRSILEMSRGRTAALGIGWVLPGAPSGRLVETAGCCGTVIGVLDPSYAYCMNMNMNIPTWTLHSSKRSGRTDIGTTDSEFVGRLFRSPCRDHPRTRHPELEAISAEM